ncbi:hypothetical protein tinsulaeT_22130 [Thalassotalea insulae]|uniref:Uncharacterized protein n=1 Tax=Thalassotalea insulae TaxID=2056778 RepID=A0ABQ6GSF6_9GAMM|nr:hypothetical protein [Thalassotalea insulae]GLX78873.1 hypothetical protein tinsulaeT_22130 [Thalassotalea insulae]
MHINSDRLKESLTELELRHIEQCTQCATERTKLMALTVSAKHIEIMQPPAAVWQDISRNVKAKKYSMFRRFLYSSAASVFFAAVTWLMWSNYNLQQQIEDVLLVNMMLEDKVNFEQRITFRQAALVEQLRNLDGELYQATTTKEKLDILQKRKELIQQHLLSTGEDENEFSI